MQSCLRRTEGGNRMADFDVQLAIVAQGFEHGTLLGEVLFFPEIAYADDNWHGLQETLARHAKRLLRDCAEVDLYRRLLGTTPEITSVTLSVTSSEHLSAWQNPVTLTFAVLRW